MPYHIKLTLSSGLYNWWNLSKDQVIEGVLIPFVNGQIVPLPVTGRNRHVLLNMKNVTFLQIYMTEKEFDRKAGEAVPPEMEKPEFEEKECTKDFVNEVKELLAGPHLTSVLQKFFSDPKEQVFVIMKIGDKYLDSAYNGVVKPVIQQFGLTALRIDEIQNSGKITDQVLECIGESRYVLADLSGERPNCYYETGFAHALGKELILTIRKEDVIHFDLAGYRFIVWETEQELRNALESRFRSLAAQKHG